MNHEISIIEMDRPSCGDGCCHDHVFIVKVDGKEVGEVLWPHESKNEYAVLMLLLNHFNVKATVNHIKW